MCFFSPQISATTIMTPKETSNNNQREGGGDKDRKKVKGHQGTCKKDTWTKPKRGRIEGGRWGWVGRGSGAGAWGIETTVLEK